MSTPVTPKERFPTTRALLRAFAPIAVISDILADLQLVSTTMGSVMVSWGADSAGRS